MYSDLHYIYNINICKLRTDHTIIKLPYVSEINLGKEFTLEDLLNANFNIKSHKFENHYELYCCTKCELYKNKIKINIEFDHGC